ncbi:prepilin-type N-terminal cleavage/methylation domain-containing protein [Geomicrobium halophilum]|uniref:Prepilin-type N-terminal cleavage/methylation domain-containing protein n=1 Tax=Geomicrobium halophilum TaxID=549000 RepID=A0A841PJJ1_9BACL|nr:type II secretion system protein [Geomicrobium halophilum]MBB6448889.1 prepilin-type N-terminal cleavage/methylation domain-containing protein [Geomicrobium halophilum]
MLKDFIRNHQGGFTLVEVMTALLILSIAVAGIIPLLSILYTERAEVQVEREAYRHLDRYGYELMEGEVETIQSEVTSFVLRNRNGDVCIHWVGPAGREKEVCLVFPS